MATQDSAARLMSLKDVTEHLGLHRNTIGNYLSAGAFPRPVVLPGGQKRFRREDVEAWVAGLQADVTPVIEETDAA